MWLTRVPVWGRWADLVSFLPVRDAVEWGQERELRMLLPMGSMLGGSHVSRVWVTGDSRAGKHLAKELAEQAWSFSRDIPVFWVKLLNITTLLWLDFLWKRKKGQNSDLNMAWCSPDEAARTQVKRQRETEEMTNETVGRALWVLRPCPQLWVLSFWGPGCIGFHWDEGRYWVRNYIVRTPCSITLWCNP